MNWQENQDSSMVERQARDLEVRVRVPVQVQIFLLKFNNGKSFVKTSDDVKIVGLPLLQRSDVTHIYLLNTEILDTVIHLNNTGIKTVKLTTRLKNKVNLNSRQRGGLWKDSRQLGT